MPERAGRGNLAGMGQVLDRSERDAAAPAPAARAAWRAVAVPSEHGGWGLTLEPVVLGLAVAPSWAGLALGAAAFGAFLVRTPAKVVAVDRHRHRHLPRTRLAARIAVVEAVVVVVLAAAALAAAGPACLVPVAVAIPLVGVEAWFERRSRGRRLAPELAGAVAVAAVAAAIAVAGGAGWAVAVGCWAVLAARSLASIPFVRTQVAQLHGREAPKTTSDLGQVAGVGVAAVAVVVAPAVAAGAAAVAMLAALQAVAVRRPPPRVAVIGALQSVAGLAVVVATAVGVAA